VSVVRASYRRYSCILVCCFPLSEIRECKLKLCHWSPFKGRNCKEQRIPKVELIETDESKRFFLGVWGEGLLGL